VPDGRRRAPGRTGHVRLGPGRPEPDTAKAARTGRHGRRVRRSAGPGNEKDESAWRANWERLHANRNAWEKPLDGLETPGGFSDIEFQWVPGVHHGEDFYDQTGLGKWAGGPDWNEEFDFYDPTPRPTI
jgi:hypothetical protein